MREILIFPYSLWSSTYIPLSAPLIRMAFHDANMIYKNENMAPKWRKFCTRSTSSHMMCTFSENKYLLKTKSLKWKITIVIVEKLYWWLNNILAVSIITTLGLSKALGLWLYAILDKLLLYVRVSAICLPPHQHCFRWAALTWTCQTQEDETRQRKLLTDPRRQG